MYNNKRFLAVIPARSGSKGLKNKNIKTLNGKPMIAYTIEAAIDSNIFDDIVVSTDSKTYAGIAKKYGAQVPFSRPDYLSTDEATTSDVVKYTIKELKKLGKTYDYFIILQPTSPLRKSEDIISAVELLFEKGADSIVSVCEAEHSPLYMNTIDESLFIDGFISKNVGSRRQEFPKYYRLNGAIYLCGVEHYLKYGDLYKEKSYAYIMERERSIDIDDELDFLIAEYLMKMRYFVAKHGDVRPMS
mgnify:FL=1